jgi:hypothetical protein
MDDMSNTPQDPEDHDAVEAPEAESTGSAENDYTIQSLYGHPLAALGGALMLAGILVFIVLLGLDYLSETENPYRSLVAFIGAPAVGFLGLLLFLIAIRVQVSSAKRQGQQTRWRLTIIPSSARYMRNLWLFLGLSAALVIIFIYAGFRGYEATESVAFCGETCHTVMGPQIETYDDSAHARVPCVECHIGPGTSFWVQSKIDGIRQVVAVARNSYTRPIHTPVVSLRPAPETCEECHWPEQFYGQKLQTKQYFRTDEQSSPWTISLLVNIGGGNPQTGRAEGIHWHMVTDSVVEYIAVDEKRQDIPWFRVTKPDGTVQVYADPSATYPDPRSVLTEKRVMDCVDCHNRPSHKFTPPAVSVNLALSKGEISRDLPFIRAVGVDLLNAEYATLDEALSGIPAGLREYYEQQYPGRVAELTEEIAQATSIMLGIYKSNFFPEMNTDYRARENNLSHFVNDGCFRCHGGDQVNEVGERLPATCDSCHEIIAQGPSADLNELQNDIAGVDFVHPLEIGDIWETVKCTQCHTRESGY